VVKSHKPNSSVGIRAVRCFDSIKENGKKSIQLNNRKLVNRILYADDKILLTISEDDLKRMAYHLNLIARKYKMTISSTKTKSMAMWGNHILKVKIMINDNIIEQVTDFKYLGHCISEFKSDF